MIVDPYSDIYEVKDIEGKKHRVFPMMLRDKQRVYEASNGMVSDTFIFANLFPPKIKDGMPELDEKGNLVIDETPYESMMALAELALHETQEQIESWADIVVLGEVIALYYNVSNLKKKTLAE